jgi:hypothetical protein
MSNKITIKNISNFIEGNLKLLGNKFNLLSNHQKEQILYRSMKCQDCAETGSCKQCGCTLPGRWYSSESCNNNERFPDIMNEENWEQYKKDNNISFD